LSLEKDESVRIGMSAEVKTYKQSGQRGGHFTYKAIQFDDTNKPYVLKRDEKNAVGKTEITIGIMMGQWLK